MCEDHRVRPADVAWLVTVEHEKVSDGGDRKSDWIVALLNQAPDLSTGTLMMIEGRLSERSDRGICREAPDIAADTRMLALPSASRPRQGRGQGHDQVVGRLTGSRVAVVGEGRPLRSVLSIVSRTRTRSGEPDPRSGGLAHSICRGRHLTMRHWTTSFRC